MRSLDVVTQSPTERVYLDRPAMDAIRAEADLIGASRVFIIASGTLARTTDEVERVRSALGDRYAGTYARVPVRASHAAVIEAGRLARAAGADLLVTMGGGTIADAAKVIALCMKHDLREHEDLEPFRYYAGEDGAVVRPAFEGPDVRIVAVPTTLSGAEFWWAGGIYDERTQTKHGYYHRRMGPVAIVLDPAVTRHTPAWLWTSTGVRAIDHACETLGSRLSNAYCDGLAEHALQLLHEGLVRVKADPADMPGRLQCLIGSWQAMTPITAGVPMGLSHAVGHKMGPVCAVPHGYTSCITAPNALSFNAAANGDRQRKISNALGAPDQPAHVLLDRLIRELGMPRRIADVVKEPPNLESLVEQIMTDYWIYTNPRPMDRADVEQFLQGLL
ncbi:MAG: iron-containing alcohol dehydrogenase [Lautropia sp.]